MVAAMVLATIIGNWKCDIANASASKIRFTYVFSKDGTGRIRMTAPATATMEPRVFTYRVERVSLDAKRGALVEHFSDGAMDKHFFQIHEGVLEDDQSEVWFDGHWVPLPPDGHTILTCKRTR